MNERLKIGIQKKGRLHDESFKLLKDCGLKTQRSSNRYLICRVQNFPIDILLIRDDDILTFTSEGFCDIGIVGENIFQEYQNDNKNLKSNIIKKLGFSKCRLSIAVPNYIQNFSINSLNKMKIATSYPKTLQQFLVANNIDAKVLKMKGSIETAPYLKISDAICDLVSSGSTLEEHSLKEVLTIFESEAVLIAHKNIHIEKTNILTKLLKRINGVITAKGSKYVMLNAPKEKIEEISAILPGSESPTITKLKDPNKVGIHAVCLEPVFWETMEQLKSLGASSILVLPIEKMME